MLKVNDRTVSELAPTISPEQRLALTGDIGRRLIDAQGDLFNKRFVIKFADHFRNCIFIALVAIIENLEGGFNAIYPDRKLVIVCAYDTVSENNNPLGELLPLLEKCYPWITLSTEVRQMEPRASEPTRVIPKNKSGVVFIADHITRVDTMRTAFGGTIQRGTIQKGDVLNVVDGSGRVLCREGIVLAMYNGFQEINKAEENQHIDELCLAVEIPTGDYPGVLLVDGDTTIVSTNQGKQTKKGFWSKLFKK